MGSASKYLVVDSFPLFYKKNSLPEFFCKCLNQLCLLFREIKTLSTCTRSKCRICTYILEPRLEKYVFISSLRLWSNLMHTSMSSIYSPLFCEYISPNDCVLFSRNTFINRQIRALCAIFVCVEREIDMYRMPDDLTMT